jgi:hypothetical protein
MSATAETAGLTRAEDAYAHLASFQRGDQVDVAGPGYFLPGIVDTPQQDAGSDLTLAYLFVSGCGHRVPVTVASLLRGRTITSLDDAKAGNVRYFDEAGYAAQNSGQR